MGVRGRKLNNSIFVLGFAVLLIIIVGYLKFHPSPEPSFAMFRHIPQTFASPNKNDRRTTQKVSLLDDAGNPLNATPTNTGHDTPIGDFIKYPCLPSIPNSSSKNTCVRMFNDTSTDVPSELQCVTLKARYGSAPICTYAPEKSMYTFQEILEDMAFMNQILFTNWKQCSANSQTCYFLI